jgi:hypothetical protein
MGVSLLAGFGFGYGDDYGDGFGLGFAIKADRV